MMFWGSSKPIQGYVGYFGLDTWWKTAFTEAERSYILKRFQPLGGGSISLVEGSIQSTSQSAIGLLGGLAGWFSKAEDRHLAHKILEKGVELAGSGGPVLHRHFLFQSALEIFYRDRDRAEFLDKAIAACEAQISLAPAAAAEFLSSYPRSSLPSHRGYEQLAIIREKQGRFDDAIKVCRIAQDQGWSGDWEGRVERYSRKRDKAL